MKKFFKLLLAVILMILVSYALIGDRTEQKRIYYFIKEKFINSKVENTPLISDSITKSNLSSGDTIILGQMGMRCSTILFDSAIFLDSKEDKRTMNFLRSFSPSLNYSK